MLEDCYYLKIIQENNLYFEHYFTYIITMMNFIKKHLALSIKLGVLLLLIILFVIFVILKNNVAIAESWSTGFTATFIAVVGTITKEIPFSLLEVGAIILATFIIFFIVMMIIDFKHKEIFTAFHRIVNIALIIFSILLTYQATAEMMYNRKPLEIPLYKEAVAKEEFKGIISYFIDDLNECCNHLEFLEDGDIVAPDISEINEKVALEYHNFQSTYLFDFTTKAKPMYLSSWLYREFHITGITFIPFAEANVNFLNVNAGKAFTLAHELAHTKGAMREGDADLVASYITLHSSDYYLRYSGYYYTIGSLMTLAKYTGNDTDYNELYNKLDVRFKKNISFNNKYWKEHNKANDFANWWNDLYLKMSGEKEGSSSYGDSSMHVNPDKEVIVFSNYQKLYFDIFYSK